MNETPLSWPLVNGFQGLVEKLWPRAQALKKAEEDLSGMLDDLGKRLDALEHEMAGLDENDPRAAARPEDESSGQLAFGHLPTSVGSTATATEPLRRRRPAC